MAFYSVGEPFGVDKAILRFNHGNYNTVHVTVPRTKLSQNAELKTAVPAGLFVAEESPGIYRYLPRAVVTQAATNAAATLKADLYYLFVPGDALYILEPYTVLTITTVSAAQTVTVTINGRTATATATNANTTDTAALLAAAINSTGYLNTFVEAIATGNTVYIVSKDNAIYSVTTAGTVTSAALSSATTAVNATAIGTVSAIAPTTGVITLTANAAIDVPVGVRIGSKVMKVLGLDIHARDFVTAPVRDISLLTQSTGVETRYLPYIDSNLVDTFSQIKFDNRW